MPKISDNRIVCPVNVWRYFTGQKANPGCTRVACCYECSKEDCIGGSGCHNEYRDEGDYPEACKVYPLTFGEAKRIFTFCGLFDDRWVQDNPMAYVYFARAVEVYIRAKKEKIKREK